MAYEKQTWHCGEVVTADKLNHMEDGIENATGFTCTEETTTLTEESVTTTERGGVSAGVLSYSELINADTIRVTFNGVEYICPKHEMLSESLYGSADETGETPMPDTTFSEYPFAIVSSTEDGNQIATAQAGTYQIKIEALAETVETTECFRKAVNSANDSSPLIFTVTMRSATTEECPLGFGGNVNEYSHSWQEIHDALVSGKPCFHKAIEGDSVYLYAIIGAVSQDGAFYINTSHNEYAFDFADANSKTFVTCADR